MSALIEEHNGSVRVLCDGREMILSPCSNGREIVFSAMFAGHLLAVIQLNRNQAAQLAVALQRVLLGTGKEVA